ncbi:MAG TPA: Vms1/Ankzf1 family peptidyl-tRNA hydrolase [Solirubrobacteraceae bacterium]|jgi:peptide subunit release factor 1 (eRF1)|nr:Vms1/Ankzf1 family peptidyl-tRNA hydrolase [Solirubrobacteraceae bacterium]
MTAGAETARRLLERAGEHPVVSLFFDLDPDQFGTAPARATQLSSLLDEAHRASRSDESLGHDDRKAVEADLSRLEDYLQSGDAPISGARTLAVFCSGPQDLFEAVPLPRPASSRVVIARRPYVEPLVAGDDGDRWCVTLVSRRTGRIFDGEAARLSTGETIADRVPSRHHQGGWSQANYQRSIDTEAEQHLRHVAGELYRQWQTQPFSKLVLGGPQQDVDRFAELLHNDLRRILSDARLSLDVETAGVAEVEAAVAQRVAEERAAAQRTAVAELEERSAAGGAAVLGLEPTLTALGERRVETLVLYRNFEAAGGRCPQCGLLYPEGTTECAADGSRLEPVADLREAAVEAAVLQDARIEVIGEGSETPPPVLVRGHGIGALLRF